MDICISHHFHIAGALALPRSQVSDTTYLVAWVVIWNESQHLDDRTV